MTKQHLVNAINNLTTKLELRYATLITVDSLIFAPSVMSNLAAVAWVKRYEEDEDTLIVREQLNHLWYGGALKFDE